jgi:hypothetical protein
MGNKGRFMYVPSELLEELEDINITFGRDNKANRMRIIAQNSRIAREIKLNLDFKMLRNKRRK